MRLSESQAKAVQRVHALGDRLLESIGKVLIGKERAVTESLCALLCQGHILAEDVPGVGKTMLARALAQSMGLSFRRIQFTPDLLPSDVIGVTIYDQREQEFQFRPGPIFAHVVLADEINRGTPRTQSALLECMEERQVTVDGKRHPMDEPFIVIATQNPIEFEGTFPLPEAQLDRFMIRVALGYPDEAEEVAMLERLRLAHPIDGLRPVVDAAELNEARLAVRHVYVSRPVGEYIVQIARATRAHPDVMLGASPRASLSLYRAAQAKAALAGRAFVLPDDVKALAAPVLGHRLLLTPEATMRGKAPEQVIDEIVQSTPLSLTGTSAGSP